MMHPLVLDLADDGVPVTVTCRVLGFSTQAFDKWRAKPVSDRDYDDAHLINAAVDVHHDDPEFGYRFITDELEGQGWTASRNRVNRLCTLQKLWSVHARRRGRYRRPSPPVHDDLVGREFTAETPNQLWFTDITEHPIAEGKLYLCAAKDACSKRIVGYSIDAHMASHRRSAPAPGRRRGTPVQAAPNGSSPAGTSTRRPSTLAPSSVIRTVAVITNTRAYPRDGSISSTAPDETPRRVSPNSISGRRRSGIG